MTTDADLYEALLKIHQKMQNPAKWGTYGICHMLVEADYWVLFAKHAEKWPKYSGRPTYPLPGQTLAFYSEKRSPAYMWDASTSEYARLRWELLEWMILYLERKINAGS